MFFLCVLSVPCGPKIRIGNNPADAPPQLENLFSINDLVRSGVVHRSPHFFLFQANGGALESDSILFLRWQDHQLFDRFKQRSNFVVVLPESVFKLFEFSGQFNACG
jgi:hypothetical protein